MRRILFLLAVVAGCSKPEAKEDPNTITIKIEGDSELMKKAVADSIEDAKQKAEDDADPRLRDFTRRREIQWRQDRGKATEEELAELKAIEDRTARRRAELNLRLGRKPSDAEEAELMKQIEREMDEKPQK